MTLFTTCDGKEIVLEKIHAVGRLVTGQLEDDHYIIYLESGKEIWINKGRDYRALSKCRQSLVDKLKDL
jgi:hypothetical protein